MNLIKNFLLIYNILVLFKCIGALNTEDQLMRHLMRSYNPIPRPSINYTLPTIVYFDVSIVQITNVDEKNQMMSINAWLMMIWTDNKLTWNESQWEGINELHLPAKNVWKPDITLYNNVYVFASKSEMSTKVIVSSNGTVTWLTATVYKSSCIIDVKYFPFDQQNCSLVFASWAYDAERIDLKLISEVADTTNYIENNEWTLKQVHSKKHEVQYSCCINRYPDITYYIIIKRRPWFYIYTMVFPSILITTTGFFGILVPLDKEKKISTGLKSLLSKTLFLMVIPDTLPPNSDDGIPLIAVYYISTMLLILTGNLFTIMTYIFQKDFPPKSSIYPFKNFNSKNKRMILIDGNDTYISPEKFAKIAKNLQQSRSQNSQLTHSFQTTQSDLPTSRKRKYFISEH